MTTDAFTAPGESAESISATQPLTTSGQILCLARTGQQTLSPLAVSAT